MNTMTSNNLEFCSEFAFDLLNEIASTSSKNEKLVLIRSAFDKSRLFKELIKIACDPFVTFGIKKVDTKSLPEGTQSICGDHLRLLSDLAARKLTGNAAKDATREALESLAPKSRELFLRVLLKNLKAGFTAESLNKVEPGLIYTFKVQLSHKLADHAEKINVSESNPWWAEHKEDGVRGFCLPHRDPSCQFLSREGKELKASEELRAEMRLLFNHIKETTDTECVFDGELVSLGGAFNDVVGDVHRKDAGDTIGFKLIDILPADEFDTGKVKIPYLERREFMESVLEHIGDKAPRISATTRWAITSVQEAFDKASELIAEGHEGIILKDPDGFWENKRTTAWLKVKDINTLDLVVKRLEPGDAGKKYEHMMGAAICDVIAPSGEKVEVSIGGGWTDQDRAHYWANPDELIGQLIEVEFHMWTPDGSLRHPRFKKIRTDKPIEDGQGC